MAIKIRLAALLAERRMKVTELSRLTGISRNALYRLYHEKNQAIDLQTLKKICDGLQCSICDLLDYVPEGVG